LPGSQDWTHAHLHPPGPSHRRSTNDVAGCEECLKTGDTWVHLRACRSCGKVDCCDSSPNRHATAHNHDTGHPIVSSAQPDEEWSFCYVDDVAFVIDDDA